MIEGRSCSPSGEEELKAQLDAANAKLAQVEAEKAKAVADAELARAEIEAKAKTETELRREVAKKGHEATISSLVSEGKIAPATVEAGLADFLMVLDGIGQTKIGGKAQPATEWFTANFMSSKIVTLGDHVADNGTASNTGVAAEIRAGLEIAACINKEIKLD